MLETRVSEAVNVPVHVGSLKFRWSSGLLIEDISIDDDPVFSQKPVLKMEKTGLVIYYKELFSRRIHADFFLDSMNINLIKDQSGQTNIEKLVSKTKSPVTKEALPEVATQKRKEQAAPQPKRQDFKQKAKQKDDQNTFSFVFPFDVKTRVHLDDISVAFEDRMAKKHVMLKNLLMHLDISSIINDPVILKILSELKVDGNDLTSPYIKVQMNNLVDSHNALDLANTHVDITGALPGIKLSIEGKLSKDGINGDIGVDLFQVAKELQPFMPPDLIGTNISGDIRLSIKASGDPLGKTNFDTVLDAKQISIAGKIIDNKKVGPVDFSVLNKGQFDAEANSMADSKTGSLIIHEGSLGFIAKSSLLWKGKLDGLSSDSIEANLEIGPGVFDIQELLGLAEPFIPPEISLSLYADDSSNAIELKKAHFSGNLSSGKGDLTLEGLSIKSQQLDVKIEPTSKGSNEIISDETIADDVPSNEIQSNEIRLKNFNFHIDSIKLALADFFPENLSLKAGTSVQEVTLKGDSDLFLKKINIPLVTIRADAIKKTDNSLFGLTAHLMMDQSLEIDKVELPSTVTIKNVKQSLKTGFDLPAGNSAKIYLKELKLASPKVLLHDLSLTKSGQPLDLGIELKSSINSVSFTGLSSPMFDISGAKALIDIGDFIMADVEADAKNQGTGSFNTKAGIVIELAPLLEKFKGFMPEDIALGLTGRANAGLQMAGRIPKEKEIEKLKNASSIIKDDLSFIDFLDCYLTMEKISAKADIKEDKYLQINRIQADPLLKYTYDQKTGKGKLTGDIKLTEITEQGLLGLKKPVGMNLYFSGSHDFINSLLFSQALEITPLNIKEDLKISVFGLNRLLKKDVKDPLSLALKTMGGSVKGMISIPESSSLNTAFDDIDIKAKVNTSVDVELVPMQVLKVRARADIPFADINVSEIIDIENLQTDIDLEKNYRIIAYGQNRPNADEEENTPLSVMVMTQKGLPATGFNRLPESGALKKDRSTEKFFARTQKRFKTRHSVSFESAHMSTGALPLEIDNSSIDFSLNKGLPNVEYFQVDMLGGTVSGSVFMLKGRQGYSIDADLKFSGIDSGKLMPDSNFNPDDMDAEISGQMTMDIPLSTDLGFLMENMEFDIEFTHIGPRTLERALYAIDPSESNETIVMQRKLLRIGSPKWIKTAVKDGNLSLYGEVKVAGALIPLPRLERVNIAGVPGLEKIGDNIADLKSVVDTLDLLSAEDINVGGAK